MNSAVKESKPNVNGKKRPCVALLKNITDGIFGFDISTRCRTRQFLTARQYFTNVCIHYGYTYELIAYQLGQANHTCVVNSNKRFHDYCHTDMSYLEEYDRFIDKLDKGLKRNGHKPFGNR